MDDRTRATLGFLDKLTLEPDAVGPADVAELRQIGLSDAAITDAIYVCGLFNTIDRVADALDFRIPEADDFAAGARFLLRFGYR